MRHSTCASHDLSILLNPKDYLRNNCPSVVRLSVVRSKYTFQQTSMDLHGKHMEMYHGMVVEKDKILLNYLTMVDIVTRWLEIAEIP